MSKLKKPNKRWLPLVMVPLFSAAVLVGCSSDDDDDDADGGTDEVTEPTDPEVTEPVDPGDDVVALDENGVPVAFGGTGDLDANGNGINDVFEQPLGGGDITDSNGNFVDDSFEAELTGGDDANTDGIDDAAAAELEAATNPVEPVVVDQTGPLNVISLPGVGTADLAWDGFNLSGQLNIDDGVEVVSAGIYTGIGAAGNGELAIALNGSAPTLFVPTGVAENTQALIAENIVSGNLFLQAQLADGNQQTGIILLDGVEPKFTELTGANEVPDPVVAFSVGQAFINVNTVTGDIAAVVRVNLNPADLDAEGNPDTITAAHIHVGGPAETGPVIVPLDNPSGDTLTWTATAQLSTADLASLLEGNTYFNVHSTGFPDGFIRGQIPASQ